MKTKLQSLGFTSGHMHLLLIAVALFSVLMVSRSNISLKTLFVKADDTQTKMLTYEDVRDQVIAENAAAQPADDPAAEAEAEQQLALLDRQLDEGQVLGDSIGIGNIPPADQLYSRDQLDTIAVTTTATTQASVALYQRNLSVAEADYDSANLIANLNSTDPEVITDAAAQTEKLISVLQTIVVPSDLADFQRYKIMYYRVLINLGNSFAGNDQGVDLKNNSTALFSLVDKIQRMSDEVYSKYGVQL